MVNVTIDLEVVDETLVALRLVQGGHWSDANEAVIFSLERLGGVEDCQSVRLKLEVEVEGIYVRREVHRDHVSLHADVLDVVALHNIGRDLNFAKIHTSHNPLPCFVGKRLDHQFVILQALLAIRVHDRQVVGLGGHPQLQLHPIGRQRDIIVEVEDEEVPLLSL